MNIIRQSSYTSIRDEPRWMVSKSSEPERQASEGEGPSRAERGIMEPWRLPGHAGRRKESSRDLQNESRLLHVHGSTAPCPRQHQHKHQQRRGKAAGRRHMRRVRCVECAQGNDASRTRAAREPGPTPRLSHRQYRPHSPPCTRSVVGGLDYTKGFEALSIVPRTKNPEKKDVNRQA